MLADAFAFLKNSDDRIPTVLVGGILTVLGVLVLPAFVVQGYLVRVLRGAARGEREAPSFTDWGRLFVDGLKLFVVNLVYGVVVLVPTVVLLAVVGVGTGATGPGMSPTGLPRVALGFAGVLLVALVVGLSVGLAYVVPAAMANFAMEGSVRAAFDLRAVVRGALTADYAVSWLLALLVAVVGGSLGSALTVVVVGAFVLFYVQVTAYYLVGRGFARGRGGAASRL